MPSVRNNAEKSSNTTTPPGFTAVVIEEITVILAVTQTMPIIRLMTERTNLTVGFMDFFFIVDTSKKRKDYLYSVFYGKSGGIIRLNPPIRRRRPRCGKESSVP